MKRTLLAALMLSLASFSMARPVSHDANSSHTLVQYHVDHLGFSMQSDYFTKLSGKVTLDSAAHAGPIDMSIDNDSLQTFWPARDKHLKSASCCGATAKPRPCLRTCPATSTCWPTPAICCSTC